MDSIIKVIPKGNIKENLGCPAEGCTASVKLLKIRDGDQEKKLFVKLYPRKMQLLNEIIGYLLAHHLGLPQPNGYVVILSKHEQEKFFGIDNPKTSTYPVWATEAVLDGDSLLYLYKNCTATLKDFLSRWEYLYATISFDDWIGNEDRNIGNLILSHSVNNVLLIDHGNIFDGFKVRRSKLDRRRYSQNKLQAYCLKERIKRKSKFNTLREHYSGIANHIPTHSEAFEKAKKEIFYWWSKLAKGHESKLYNYLYHRGNPNAHIIHNKYNLLELTV